MFQKGLKISKPTKKFDDINNFFSDKKYLHFVGFISEIKLILQEVIKRLKINTKEKFIISSIKIVIFDVFYIVKNNLVWINSLLHHIF